MTEQEKKLRDSLKEWALTCGLSEEHADEFVSEAIQIITVELGKISPV